MRMLTTEDTEYTETENPKFRVIRVFRGSKNAKYLVLLCTSRLPNLGKTVFRFHWFFLCVVAVMRPIMVHFGVGGGDIGGPACCTKLDEAESAVFRQWLDAQAQTA